MHPVISSIDTDKTKHNLNTYWGRCRYFFEITNPLNLLTPRVTLEKAKDIVQRHRNKLPQDSKLTPKDLYKAKILYDSAYHPKTGEIQTPLGRMSAQVPANTVLAACLTFFHKNTIPVVFWQWVAQSFNALVNYTNRSGDDQIATQQIIKSYMSSTISAVIVALVFKNLTANASTLTKRFVPFLGCSVAHCVNVPLMRENELRNGIVLYDENGNKIGKSTKAARLAIVQVVITRIVVSSPSMLGVPIVMQTLGKRLGNFMNPFAAELVLGGLGFAIATPMGCAIFKQYQDYDLNKLEDSAQKEVQKIKRSMDQIWIPTCVYFNKGL